MTAKLLLRIRGFRIIYQGTQATNTIQISRFTWSPTIMKWALLVAVLRNSRRDLAHRVILVMKMIVHVSLKALSMITKFK
jgi:hypothetical protein